MLTRLCPLHYQNPKLSLPSHSDHSDVDKVKPFAFLLLTRSYLRFSLNLSLQNPQTLILPVSVIGRFLAQVGWTSLPSHNKSIFMCWICIRGSSVALNIILTIVGHICKVFQSNNWITIGSCWVSMAPLAQLNWGSNESQGYPKMSSSFPSPVTRNCIFSSLEPIHTSKST